MNFWGKGEVSLELHLSLNKFQCISGVKLRHLSLVLPFFCFHHPKWLNEEKIVQRLIGMIHPSKDDNVSSNYNYRNTCLYINCVQCLSCHWIGFYWLIAVDENWNKQLLQCISGILRSCSRSLWGFFFSCSLFPATFQCFTVFVWHYPAEPWTDDPNPG